MAGVLLLHLICGAVLYKNWYPPGCTLAGSTPPLTSNAAYYQLIINFSKWWLLILNEALETLCKVGNALKVENLTCFNNHWACTTTKLGRADRNVYPDILMTSTCCNWNSSSWDMYSAKLYDKAPNYSSRSILPYSLPIWVWRGGFFSGAAWVFENLCTFWQCWLSADL